MHFAHPLPWWGLVGGALLAAALAWGVYRRAALLPSQRALLVGLRLLALILLGLVLMRPMAPVTGRASDAVVAVLVDTSRSMALADVDETPRLARAQRLVEAALVPSLEPAFQTEVFTFGDGLRQAEGGEWAASARRSDLGAAVQAAAERFRERSLAAIVVVSDGGDTGVQDLADAGQAAGVPVMTVGIGAPAPARDREVRSVSVGQSALDASLVDLTATVVSHGEGRPLDVRLLQHGRPIDQATVAPSSDGTPVQVAFTVAPDRLTPSIYTVDVASDPAELTPGNNRADVVVTPPARRRRLLVLEGAPGFEHTFVKRAWADDPSVEVDSVVRKGQNDQGADTYFVQAAGARTQALAGGFPDTREALYVYDLVVVANVSADGLTRDQLSWVGEFVSERGGGLLLFGGRAFDGAGFGATPLDEALPIRLSERGGGIVRTASRLPGGAYRVALTPEGARHPAMRIGRTDEETVERWAALPALAGGAELGAPRAGASVLAVMNRATGDPVPLVTVQRFGAGRSLVFSGEASWRWRMELPVDDRTFETFWRQVARWLSAESPDPVSLSVPRVTVPGDAVPLEVLVRNAEFKPVSDAAVTLDVTLPDGGTRRVAAGLVDPVAGRYSASLSALEPGMYRAVVDATHAGGPLGRAEQTWLVGGQDRELADPRLNDAVLRRLAESSGGRFLAEREAGGLAAAVEDAGARVRPVELRDLWHNAWTLLALVALLSVEWSLRRRWGLR